MAGLLLGDMRLVRSPLQWVCGAVDMGVSVLAAAVAFGTAPAVMSARPSYDESRRAGSSRGASWWEARGSISLSVLLVLHHLCVACFGVLSGFMKYAARAAVIP